MTRYHLQWGLLYTDRSRNSDRVGRLKERFIRFFQLGFHTWAAELIRIDSSARWFKIWSSKIWNQRTLIEFRESVFDVHTPCGDAHTRISGTFRNVFIWQRRNGKMLNPKKITIWTFLSRRSFKDFNPCLNQVNKATVNDKILCHVVYLWSMSTMYMDARV